MSAKYEKPKPVEPLKIPTPEEREAYWTEIQRLRDELKKARG